MQSNNAEDTSPKNNDAEDIIELKELMDSFISHSANLKDHLLDGAIIRHKGYAIKRERDIFTPVKYDAAQNVVASLFQIESGDPLNTKEAELFPGFIQVKASSFNTTNELTSNVNTAKTLIKDFLKARKRKTTITTDNGVVYTQNPLMFRHFPMVNTMQLYRNLTCILTDTSKSSFLWQSNKRYLKYDLTKTTNIINSALLSPLPLQVDPKAWKKDLSQAIERIDRLPPDFVITRICSTEPKPHFKFKPKGHSLWTRHYGATPIIIANKDDELFTVGKKMKAIDVINKHRNLPIGAQWTPFCESLNLYYQR